MDNPFKSPAVFSYCTGLRGLERGVESVIGPINTVLYLEIEAFICFNLVKQMEQGILAPAPIWSDIKTFAPEPFRERVHGFIGGYPCQPFSLAGRRNGIQDPRHLWPFISRHISTIRPVWCYFENVDDHLTLGFAEVQRDLWRMGYAVEAGIFTAQEAGAPHERQRLFILAISYTALPRLEDWKAEFSQEFTSTERSSFVANSTGTNDGPISEWESGQKRCKQKQGFYPYWCSEKLADPDSRGRRGRDQENHGLSEGTIQIEGPGSLAHTTGGRRKKFRHIGKPATTQNSGISGPGPNGEWPAGYGQEQKAWEHPRIESSMGFSINGYNFREDLLRMAGNGVVPQSAQLAFINLYNKHINNYDKCKI